MHIDHSHSYNNHTSMLYNPDSHSGNFNISDSNECLIHNSIAFKAYIQAATEVATTTIAIIIAIAVILTAVIE